MTKIQWTERTWNPLVGCSKVASGCERCYAVPMAARLEWMGQGPYQGLTTNHGNGMLDWTGVVRTLMIQCGDLLTEFNASQSDFFWQSKPRCCSGVYGEGNNEFCLLSFGDQIWQHPLAKQLCSSSGDSHAPLPLENRPAPACCTSSHIGMVVMKHDPCFKQFRYPIYGRLMGHSPTNSRIVGSQPVRMCDIDGTVAISESSEIGYRCFVKQFDFVGAT